MAQREGTMEDRDEETGITKHKMKKKRKLDDSQDYVTKKRKKKSTDEEEEKDDKEHKKRKRDKENYCKERYRSSTKIRERKVEKEQEERIDTSATTERKKKKNIEKSIKEFAVTEACHSGKKKKKKKKREGNITLDSSFEHSFTEIPPVIENEEEKEYKQGEIRERKRNKRERKENEYVKGELKEKESQHVSDQHTVFKPLLVQEKKAKRSKVNVYRDQGSMQGIDESNSHIYKSRREMECKVVEEEKEDKANFLKHKRRKMEGIGKEVKHKSLLGQKNLLDEDNHIQENRRKKVLYPNQEISRGEKNEKQRQSTERKDRWRKKILSKEITGDRNGDNEKDERGKLTHRNGDNEKEERGKLTHQEGADEGENQTRNTFKQMTKPKDISSHLPYSSLYGWETDTSIDDLDYSDDQYHQTPAAIRSRVVEARRGATAQHNVIYTEGDEVEDVVMNPKYFSHSDDEVVSVDVPSWQRASPGFVLKARDIPTLEEAIYRFPEEVGVPPEEVEDVDDLENYWILKERVLQVASCAEEAREYIDAKIKHIEDYFERLKRGQLDASELKEKRPENFDEPFYPTPHQLEFLDTLNIVVDWQLSDLHKHHLKTLTLPSRNQAQWGALQLYANTTRFSPVEDRLIVRNWFAFAKEYGFFDLRPLLSVRTARLVQEDGLVKVQPFEYVSHANRVHFLLYLAKDLPTRTLEHINRRILKLLPFIHGRCLMRQSRVVSGPLLARLLYVMELFGVDMVAAELLVGRSLRSYFKHCFKNHIMLRDIKLRVGPWRKEEDARFLLGLQEVLRVSSFREAYRLRRIPWMAIFPYVRTRGISYMRRRLIVLATEEGEKEHQSATKMLMAKYIKLVCQQQVDDFTQLDWEGLARQVGAANPIRLVWSFRKLYHNHIPYKHKNTVPDGLRYMQEHLLPFYEEYSSRSIPQLGNTDHQEPQHTHHSDLPHPNPSDVPPPNHDPGNHNNDPADLRYDPDDPEIDITHESPHPSSAATSPCASNRVVNKAVYSYHTKVRPTPGDLKHVANKDNGMIERIRSSSQDYHPRIIKKVNSNPLFDPSRPRKVTSNPWDQRCWKKPNSHQEYHRAIKKPLNENPNPSNLAHDHCNDDPVTSVLPSPFDPITSDDEDELTSSDSDADDFELETLSQAVSRSVSHGRRK